MTNHAGQRIEPAVTAAFSLIEMRCGEGNRTGKLEYAAPLRRTWRSGRADMVTVAGPPGCSREPSGPMGW
jgi:hypothetical protein